MFGAIAQVVSIPFSFLTTGLTTIIAPTGDPDPSAIIGIIVAVVLTQVVTLLIQSVAVVVQATATAIIYIDCRMRREGLDIDLLTYVERRDAGAIGLADPYRENIGRVIAPAPRRVPGPRVSAGRAIRSRTPARRIPRSLPRPGVSAQPAGVSGQPPGVSAPQGYRAAAVSAAAAGLRSRPGGPGAPAPHGYAPPPPAAPAPGASAAVRASRADRGGPAPAPTRWTAPGAPADAIDPESPWS